MTSDKQKGKLQQPEAGKKFLHRIIIFSFVMQAALIGIQGSHNVLSGKPVFDVLQGMIAQGIELILKAQHTEESIKKRDR
jgi:hypothetical protein